MAIKEWRRFWIVRGDCVYSDLYDDSKLFRVAIEQPRRWPTYEAIISTASSSKCLLRDIVETTIALKLTSCRVHYSRASSAELVVGREQHFFDF